MPANLGAADPSELTVSEKRWRKKEHHGEVSEKCSGTELLTVPGSGVQGPSAIRKTLQPAHGWHRLLANLPVDNIDLTGPETGGIEFVFPH